MKSAMIPVLNELLEYVKNRGLHCDNNCGDQAKEGYTRYIFWRKYEFCGEWCQLQCETDIRKSWRMRRRDSNITSL